MRGHPIPPPDFDDEKLARLISLAVRRYGPRLTGQALGLGQLAVLRLSQGLECRLGTLSAARANIGRLEEMGLSFDARSGAGR